MNNRHIAVFLAALLPALFACRRAPTSPEKAPEPPNEASAKEEKGLPETVKLSAAARAEAGVATWTVKPVDLEHMLVLTGSVQHDENRLVQLAANVRGRVVSLPVDFGAPVRAGDPVVLLESVDLGRAREELVRELSALRVSERAYARAKTLSEAKAISAGELQAREGDHQAKRAAADAAERTLHLLGEGDAEIAALKRTVEDGRSGALAGDPPRLAIRAPFAGRVIDRKVTAGSLVEALQPLATVADLSTVWVFLSAYEKDLALLKTGLPVTIRTETYPQESFKGHVDFLGSIVDSATRTVRVRASVENRAEKLRPGMFVRAQVDVPRPRSEAHAIVAVPQAALQTLEGRTHLFVEVQPGVFARRVVETGHTFEGFTEVLAGVKAGEAVVTEGSFVLKSEFAKATLAAGD